MKLSKYFTLGYELRRPSTELTSKLTFRNVTDRTIKTWATDTIIFDDGSTFDVDTRKYKATICTPQSGFIDFDDEYKNIKRKLKIA